MKKFLLTLLAILVIVAALGGAGFAGYRIGFMQGRQVAVAAKPNTNNNQPSLKGVPPPMLPGRNFGFGPDFGKPIHSNPLFLRDFYRIVPTAQRHGILGFLLNCNATILLAAAQVRNQIRNEINQYFVRIETQDPFRIRHEA